LATSWYKRVWYSMVEHSRSCIELIFCGLHHFDQVLEMDEVLELVSPDILGWDGLIRIQEQHALEYTNAPLQLCYQLTDEGRQVTWDKENTRKESLDLDAQVNISCKPMQKGRVWQSHERRDGTHKEHSCRDPFGSMKEPLP
jgi:hypothetical protein